jgi:hypothetical protein
VHRRQPGWSVSVQFYADHTTGTLRPWRLKLDGGMTVRRLGLHHTYKRGRRLIHVFGVVAGNRYLGLEMNSATLHWTCEEIADAP